ncbi:hypothetical protein FDH86_gp028 [Arthrobacter phage Tank]|uniref:Uncharacterized protein n=1 Tax=Arthrobacter phage Tank TaxID=1772319 RepID=A0A0U4KBA2_9CAUD|nr:hypothetical protein FDH86_gp028 [Arthrobacter phage Tank]ALY10563.1 hypothetical protein TANK_28 [Arthrobacter phage Tank]
MVFIRVHEHKVREFIQPGGEVYDLVYNTAKTTKYLAAEVHINSRSGELKRSLQVNRPHSRHTLGIASLVFTRAKHALWVHDGTANAGTGYIYPKNGKYLVVPGKKGGSVRGGTLRKVWRNGSAEATGSKPYFTTLAVRGQKPNPYLEKALSEAMGRLSH